MTIGEWNDFKTYVYRTGLGVKSGEKKGKVITHLLLDGGTVAVPPDREQEFLEKYAKELLAGTDLYVVEMKTEPCFFFMSEFDIKMRRDINQEELLQFVRVVQSVMDVAFPYLEDADSNVGVLTVDSKPSKTKDGIECIQSGVHLNWRIPVDLNTAWLLRAWIIRTLDQQLPPLASGMFPLLEPWFDCYDPCVLLKNGLRMVGSKKAECCEKCRGKRAFQSDKGAACEICKSVGRIDKGRPYHLAMVLDRHGDPIPEALEYYQSPANIIDLVKFLSIRCPPGNAEYSESTAITFPDEATEKKMTEAARQDRIRAKKKGAVPAAADVAPTETKERKRQEKREKRDNR